MVVRVLMVIVVNVQMLMSCDLVLVAMTILLQEQDNTPQIIRAAPVSSVSFTESRTP